MLSKMGYLQNYPKVNPIQSPVKRSPKPKQSRRCLLHKSQITNHKTDYPSLCPFTSNISGYLTAAIAAVTIASSYPSSLYLLIENLISRNLNLISFLSLPPPASPLLTRFSPSFQLCSAADEAALPAAARGLPGQSHRVGYFRHRFPKSPNQNDSLLPNSFDLVAVNMPQRHSKNNNDLAFFTYDEKRKLGYGTQNERLGRDSIKPFNACSLCLKPFIEPMSCLKGHIFCRECILECLLAQKKDMNR